MKYYSTLSFLKSWNNYSNDEFVLNYFTHLYGNLKLIAPKTIFNPKNYRTTLQYITFSNNKCYLYLKQVQIIKEISLIQVADIHDCSLFFLEIYFSCYNKKRINVFKPALMGQLSKQRSKYFILKNKTLKFSEYDYIQKNLIVFNSPRIPRFFLIR